METDKKKDWFRPKRYPHIGLPLKPKDKPWLSRYLHNKSAIARHGFSPFIHRTIEERKFRREKNDDGSRSKLRKPDLKEREIYFANHLDSAVYTQYTQILSKEYEVELINKGISECVTAYRRVKLNPANPNSRNKCNVDFAKDVFQHIKAAKETDLVAIAFDIKSFFDNLNHKLLKMSWRNVLKSGFDLPPDHYNVFRNITKFSYVEENDIFNCFRKEILVERAPSLVKNKEVKKARYMRNQRAIAFCEEIGVKTLRERNLIKANKYEYCPKCKSKGALRSKGIPQGSPMSAMLANLYLLDFDIESKEYCNNIDGIYRRYSDDMVIICKPRHEKRVIKDFMASIAKYKLEIQPHKTQVFHFNWSSGDSRHYCSERNLQTNKTMEERNFEYLGFQFDGKITRLKDSGLSKYYRKMKRAIKRGKFFAAHNRTSTKGELFKSRLYKRYTYVGASRRRVYKRHPTKQNEFVLSHKYDWGNFITYAKLAERIIPDNAIASQLRRHWRKFHEELNR